MTHEVQAAAGSAPLVQRVRHELKLRDLEVTAVDSLSPGFVAITFKGEALADFTSLGFDDHVKLMFGEPGEGQARRDYTPRRFSREARELVIEFALHGTGAASDWARAAKPGDRLLVGGPRGSMIVPLELGWHLLVGDDTALPAISRRLEELPAGSRAFVLVLAGEADRRRFAGAAQAELRWMSSNDELLAALRALSLPAAETGFAWGGGEAGLMAQVRQVLLEKGVPKQHMRVSAYWKRGVADHHEDL
ncbi:NADPH-dependent ferric-chelate reductase [Massilia sp. Bi118]|uniref:siderophore-interacting protein n=1 Tax=Massilia sp. Bi118 TaxID=2822346 RepID=UPI001D8D1910|nr:siderophore-interacting protein [Massilia sp. Bi118]CAH0281926.1 NADPH-dependent ferric-chelate reductase [Massilia sp. Bi118]